VVKIINEMLCLPKEMARRNVIHVVEHFLGSPNKSSSKHIVYDIDEKHNIAIPKSGNIKNYLIKQVIGKLNLEVWYEEHKNKKEK